jgi:hypothetical protein
MYAHDGNCSLHTRQPYVLSPNSTNVSPPALVFLPKYFYRSLSQSRVSRERARPIMVCAQSTQYRRQSNQECFSSAETSKRLSARTEGTRLVVELVNVEVRRGSRGSGRFRPRYVIEGQALRTCGVPAGQPCNLACSTATLGSSYLRHVHSSRHTAVAVPYSET